MTADNDQPSPPVAPESADIAINPPEPKEEAVQLEKAPVPLQRAKPDYRGINRDAILGGVLVVLLILIKLCFERTGWGESTEFAAYDGIQSLLATRDCPVVVVDITAIPSTTPGRSIPWTSGRYLTDRKLLADLITKIAAEKPAAIGVDLDFSPDYDPVSPPGLPPEYHGGPTDDPQLFDLCLQLARQGTPVYLGIFRSSQRPRDEMLVRPEYAPLAADIRVNLEDNRIMPESFRWSVGSTVVPTLAASVATAYRGKLATVPTLFAWAVSDFEDSPLEGGGKVRQFRVDFSAIDKLVGDTLHPLDSFGEIDPSQFDEIKSRLHGSIVLLGACDADHPKDRQFAVAGRHRQAYPGVYIHASAAYTLARHPLLSLTWAGRIAIDVLLATIVLCVVWLYRARELRRGAGDSHRASNHSKLPKAITLTVITAAFIFGVLFVNQTHIIWDDFIMVLLAMLLHLPLERHLEPWVERIRNMRETRRLAAKEVRTES